MRRTNSSVELSPTGTRTTPRRAHGRAVPSIPPMVWSCALFALVFAGCHYRDPSIDILESELRHMEDQVYMLEDELERKCADLNACQQVPADCQTLISDEPPRVIETPEILSEPTPSRAAPPSTPQKKDPSYEVIPSPEPDLENIEPPRIELPPSRETRRSAPSYEVVPQDEPTPAQVPAPGPLSLSPPAAGTADSMNSGSSTDSADPSADEPTVAEPSLLQPPDELPTPAGDPSSGPPQLDTQSGTRNEPGMLKIGLATHLLPMPVRQVTDPSGDGSSPVDAHVTHLVAQAWLAHAQGFEGLKSDADLLVVIEPRNCDGAPVLLGAPISLVLLDGSQSPESARVARWDFDAAAARRMARSSRYGGGMHLELNWKDPPQRTDQLHLFVRYVTVEEKKLETDTKVLTAPPPPIARRSKSIPPGSTLESPQESHAASHSPPTLDAESPPMTEWRAASRSSAVPAADHSDTQASPPVHPGKIPLRPIPRALEASDGQAESDAPKAPDALESQEASATVDAESAESDQLEPTPAEAPDDWSPNRG